MRFLFLILAFVLFAVPVQACDYGMALGRFAAPAYDPEVFDAGCAPAAAFAPSYGFQAQTFYAPQRFAAPVYAPRAFAPAYIPARAFAPVYASRAFVPRAFAPAYGGGSTFQFNLFNRQRVTRQRGFVPAMANGY